MDGWTVGRTDRHKTMSTPIRARIGHDMSKSRSIPSQPGGGSTGHPRAASALSMRVGRRAAPALLKVRMCIRTRPLHTRKRARPEEGFGCVWRGLRPTDKGRPEIRRAELTSDVASRSGRTRPNRPHPCGGQLFRIFRVSIFLFLFAPAALCMTARAQDTHDSQLYLPLAGVRRNRLGHRCGVPSTIARQGFGKQPCEQGVGGSKSGRATSERGHSPRQQAAKQMP